MFTLVLVQWSRGPCEKRSWGVTNRILKMSGNLEYQIHKITSSAAALLSFEQSAKYVIGPRKMIPKETRSNGAASSQD